MTSNPPSIPAEERPFISPSRAAVRAQLRLHWGHVMSVLVSQLGDLLRADAALREAAEAAVEIWPREGAPTAPKAWLLRVARRKAVDQYRRELRHQQKQEQILNLSAAASRDEQSDSMVPDLRLRLMFGCAHPSLEMRVRIGLLLNCVCGLDAAQVAKCMQLSELSLAQQLARAKKRLRGMSGVFALPNPLEWNSRRDSLMAAVQGVYRVGRSADPTNAQGDNLCELGLWLSTLVFNSCSEDAEVVSLAALLQMTQACREGRLGVEGEVLALEDQDTKKWDLSRIFRAKKLLDSITPPSAAGSCGPQQLQARIAAEQIAAIASAKAVDWEKILGSYQLLYGHWPTPAVALNAAMALSKARGARAGLQALEQLGLTKNFRAGESFYNAKAEMCMQLGQRSAARQALSEALQCPQISGLARQSVERKVKALGGPITDLA